MDSQELLYAIRSVVREEIHPIKEDIAGMKEDIAGLKTDVANLKEDVSVLKDELGEVKQRVTKIEITQETVTNKKLELLFEGQRDTLDKFHQLDELADKVEDIQTTVEVLKVLTVKK